MTDSKMFFLWKSRLVGFQSFVYWLLVLCSCKVRPNYFADILRYFTTVHQPCVLFYFQLSAMQGCTCVVLWCVQLFLSFCKSRKILAKKYILGLIRGSEWDIMDIWVNFWIKYFWIRMIMMGGGDSYIVGKTHIRRLCYFSGLRCYFLPVYTQVLFFLHFSVKIDIKDGWLDSLRGGQTCF